MRTYIKYNIHDWASETLPVYEQIETFDCPACGRFRVPVPKEYYDHADENKILRELIRRQDQNAVKLLREIGQAFDCPALEYARAFILERRQDIQDILENWESEKWKKGLE